MIGDGNESPSAREMEFRIVHSQTEFGNEFCLGWEFEVLFWGP
jgi:hypothetical protein